ncbi:sigma-70 family RNA polymerase sigma factor [Acidobacteria bacterium AH-259-L09]|nr:sigma-70 family RNA polymerase sigma factor [Acidobacteria bacterium AH-259-L09]
MTDIALSQPISSIGDNALISAYLQGNEDAFEVLVSRYQNKLVNYLNTLIHDYDMAVDLSQEAFIRVYQNANRYQGQYQFSTWLYRIATNLAIDEMRRRQRKGRFFLYNVMSWFHGEDKTFALPDLRHSPEKNLDQKEKLRRLQKAIASLPENYRLAFILKEVQELSYEETSKILRISLGTVKSRVHRAKMLLRDKLWGLL